MAREEKFLKKAQELYDGLAGYRVPLLVGYTTVHNLAVFGQVVDPTKDRRPQLFVKYGALGTGLSSNELATPKDIEWRGDMAIVKANHPLLRLPTRNAPQGTPARFGGDEVIINPDSPLRTYELPTDESGLWDLIVRQVPNAVRA